MERIYICRGCALSTHRDAHAQGRNVLMLEYERMQIRDHTMARRLQGMWRKKRARDMIKKLLHSVVRKHFDPSSGQFYYVNERSGTISWETVSYTHLRAHET